MKEIKFADVGEGITEGHVQKYLVKDGEAVKEDQPIFKIETDKAIVDIPSPIDGKVRFIAKEDSIVHVGETIAVIGTDEELRSFAAEGPAAPKQQAKPAPAAVAGIPQIEQPMQRKEIIATPAVRKLAHDLNIDISKISGTGPQGRILENDVRNAAHQTAIQTKPVPKFSEVLEEQHMDEVERVQMTQTRKAIARNMEASWTIPRATHMDLIDATALFDIVQKERPKVEKDFSLKLTFLPFIIKATIEALKENPRFNSSYDHERMEIILKKYYNIGLAAEAPDGLKVVVIKNADRKSMLELAKEIKTLHEKIQNQTITLEEMRDSTFTITNIGSLGGGFLSVPMINYPEVAILGIHIIRDMPIVKDGKIMVGKVLPFSLVFDHRVVDGADAVKFGNALIKYLEDPDFLEMLG